VKTIVVCAAVIENGGRFLVTRRQQGVHLEGHWEFPGGKCDAGETLGECLQREIREELDVEATVAGELLATSHQYEDRTVELHFFKCVLQGSPRPMQGQEMRWVARTHLRDLTFPPADEELIELLTDSHERQGRDNA
jgi:8-oxo-dGTP diphosphatase